MSLRVKLDSFIEGFASKVVRKIAVVVSGTVVSGANDSKLLSTYCLDLLLLDCYFLNYS